MAVPGLERKRAAYQAGLAAGRRSKFYDDHALRMALDRFYARYPIGVHYGEDWLEGWRDAAVDREIKARRERERFEGGIER